MTDKKVLRRLDVTAELSDAEFLEAVEEGMNSAVDEIEQIVLQETRVGSDLLGTELPRMPNEMVMLYVGMQLWLARKQDDELLDAVRAWFLAATREESRANG